MLLRRPHSFRAGAVFPALTKTGPLRFSGVFTPGDSGTYNHPVMVRPFPVLQTVSGRLEWDNLSVGTTIFELSFPELKAVSGVTISGLVGLVSLDLRKLETVGGFMTVLCNRPCSNASQISQWRQLTRIELCSLKAVGTAQLTALPSMPCATIQRLLEPIPSRMVDGCKSGPDDSASCSELYVLLI